jgi:arylsulfatase A-like enzyme/Flp pilus assembly protein TadD
MTIRRDLAAGVLLAAAALVTGCRRGAESPSPSSSGAAASSRPVRDVVLVTIDTLRYDATGFDGNGRGTTPHLDRLAAAGRVFSAAHSHNVITLPSHTNILTGLYPYEHGVRENAGFRLSSKLDTIATRLKSRGYATGAFVGAFPLDSRYGLTRGFDVYEEMYKQTEEPEDFQIQQARADEVVSKALEWYRGQAGKPRFLWVHVYDPHAPYDPPAAWRDKFPDDLYLGEVAYTDAALAPLFDAVTAVSPAPLLVVTGDHGEARGDHGELTHGLFAYEATLHVPMLVWCPELVSATGKDSAPARHVDYLPTVLDALGIEKPPELHGRSLLADRSKGAAPEDSYFESLSATLNRGWAPLRGILEGREKFIDLPVPELYDLEKDPAEAHNLAAAGIPDAVRRLRKRLLEVPAGSLDRSTVDAEEAAKLRSLGYLSGNAEARASYGPADDPKNLIAVDRDLHNIVELFQLQKSKEAIPIARKLVREHPKMKAGYLQLGYLLQQNGDPQGALRVYEQAIANGLGGESLDRKRGLLLSESGQPAAAVRVLEPYRESEDLETLNALGIAMTDAGRPQDGLVVFSRALALQPRNALAFLNSGIAYIKLDRLEDARASLEKALSISRRSPRALNALGVVYSRLGQPRKALEAWSACVRVDPTQWDALYNLGRVAGELGDWKKAREALTQFADTAPPQRYAKDIREVRGVLAAMPK